MNITDLPDSYELKREPFIFPSNYRKVGIIADIHIPYHSISSLLIALEFLKKMGADSVLVDGDFIDMHFQSRFQHDPRKRSTVDELNATDQFLWLLRKEFNNVFCKFGNHELRYEKWLMDKAPELLGIAEFRLDVLLKFGEKKIECIDDKTMIKIGGLSVFHGHELNIKSAIVNPARTLYLKTNVSSLMAHLHVPSQHNKKRADGHITGCWSIGHLSEEMPDYAVYNDWVHGFAMVDVQGHEFEVSNYKILKGKVFRT